MKLIPLTQGQSAIVDDWWYDHLMQWKWHARWHKQTKDFYAMRTEKGKKILMHRVVAKTPDGMQCDHIHHHTLDNREAELRNATAAQSQANRRMQVNNSSGYKGVDKHGSNWRVRISKDGKLVFQKNFKTPIEAALAYDKVAKEVFGEFAHLNFPDDN